MQSYNLQIILVCMKMKMNSAFRSSISSGWAKIDENVVIFESHDVVHGPLDTTWHFIQLQL